MTNNLAIRVDSNKFDKFQVALASNIVSTVYSELSTLGLPEEKLGELIFGIAFDICCLIDGTRPLETEAPEASTFLTFTDTGSSLNEVISCGGNSYTHEYVAKLVNKLREDVSLG